MDTPRHDIGSEYWKYVTKLSNSRTHESASLVIRSTNSLANYTTTKKDDGNQIKFIILLGKSCGLLIHKVQGRHLLL